MRISFVIWFKIVFPEERYSLTSLLLLDHMTAHVGKEPTAEHEESSDKEIHYANLFCQISKASKELLSVSYTHLTLPTKA